MPTRFIYLIILSICYTTERRNDIEIERERKLSGEHKMNRKHQTHHVDTFWALKSGKERKIDFRDDDIFFMMMTSPYSLHINATKSIFSLSFTSLSSSLSLTRSFRKLFVRHNTDNHVTIAHWEHAQHSKHRIPCEEKSSREEKFVLLVLWRYSLHADTVCTFLPEWIKKREFDYKFFVYVQALWCENLIKKERRKEWKCYKKI